MISPALFLEVFIEVVEHLGAALDPFRIVLGRNADALDQRLDAGHLGTTELTVLEIDVMHDLADRPQCAVLRSGTIEQHLERALVALVGEFRLEHVEAQLAGLWAIPLARYEFESRFRID